MSEKKCPFCGEPVKNEMFTGSTMFRCGTYGPDKNGEFTTGHTCDITCWGRVLRIKEAEIHRLTSLPCDSDRANDWLKRKAPEHVMDSLWAWRRIADIGLAKHKAEIERLTMALETESAHRQADNAESRTEIERLTTALRLACTPPGRTSGEPGVCDDVLVRFYLRRAGGEG